MLDDDDRSDDELSKTPPPRCVVAGLTAFVVGCCDHSLTTSREATLFSLTYYDTTKRPAEIPPQEVRNL